MGRRAQRFNRESNKALLLRAQLDLHQLARMLSYRHEGGNDTSPAGANLVVSVPTDLPRAYSSPTSPQ